MKFKYSKIEGTFLIGITFANGNYHGKRHTHLVFDLGKHTFYFIFRGEN